MSKIEIIETSVGPAKLKRTSRKTMAISVMPDGTVELVAPAAATVGEILKKIEKRHGWIQSQRRTFQKMNAMRPVPRYVNGATHRYLGRQYRLKISVGITAEVKLVGSFFQITTPTKTEEEVKCALNNWFKERALEQFSRRLERWHQWCIERKLLTPKLRLRVMQKRWGSTQRDGHICLTPFLIQAPSACVDYVIAHEICHLKYPNHSPRFIRLLSAVCPNWRALKSRLEHAEL